MMENKFAARIAALRKQNGWSQKQAAQRLGISQALLSHYEKGIRECGLDFVIKAAGIFGVSSDYLLGLTNRRPDFDELPDGDNITGDLEDYPVLLLGRSQVLSALNILYSVTARIGNQKLQNDFNSIWYANIYYSLRLLHSALSKQSSDLFSMPLVAGLTSARAMAELALTNLHKAASSMKLDETLTKRKLNKEYAQGAKSLINVIETVENRR